MGHLLARSDRERPLHQPDDYQRQWNTILLPFSAYRFPQHGTEAVEKRRHSAGTVLVKDIISA